ncbi:MAG: CPBP family intramembrane metalloprotease [Bacillota bacterium]|nr:CPBP family intramembrane metalloprotease [Bacillota bacterium]
MKKIFINKNSQVRSGWKIASVFSSFFIGANLLAGIIVFIYFITEVISKKISLNQVNNIQIAVSNISSPLGFACNIVQCLCMIFFVVLFWKVYDKRKIKEIGFINIKKGYKDLIIGLIFGAVSLIIVFIVLLVTKNILLLNSLTKPNIGFSLVTGLIVFIFVGINEEMFSRGYCMTVLKQTNNKYVVVIVSAIIFSLMHSLNPGMNPFCYVNLFLFGLLTAYMAIKSSNLWLSIGYHITWNYFEGNVCGFLVSGQGTSGMYNLKIPANNFINGGEFGPEGGIVVTIIILLGFIYLWKFYKPSLDASSQVLMKK